MTMIRFVLLTVLLVLYTNIPLSFALSVETHMKINEKIVENKIGFDLGDYLNNKLGFTDGTIELIKFQNKTQKAWEWIKDGGLYEDLPQRKMYNPLTWIPYTRSFNHFHDPVVPLANAGYIWPFESAIIWSQRPVGEQYRGLYSWHDARKYFYNALTLTDKASRDTNFAEMFRGVGQLMHLVSDMIVPEHSRNEVELGRPIV